MTKYYWETLLGYGNFYAKTDEEALLKIPRNCLALYKKSETDGHLLLWYKERYKL